MPEKKSESRRPDLSDFIPEEALKHAKAARKEMRKSMEAIFPPGFMEHRRAARKEILLAAREIINHALDRVEDA
ncbi:MAG: hypothetical protein OEY93_11755 [Anaerolineae bacterium]|nr:hypothetical protein [Anaerolineae bacterium]